MVSPLKPDQWLRSRTRASLLICIPAAAPASSWSAGVQAAGTQAGEIIRAVSGSVKFSVNHSNSRTILWAGEHPGYDANALWKY